MTASIQQPNPAGPLGYWPAFWALGAPLRTTGSWPQAGEIDMLEDINGHNLASQNLHYGSNGQSGPRWSACPGNGSTCQTGYHAYTVLINRLNTRSESLQFLIDNTVEQTVTESSVGTSAWQAAVDHGFYLILNLAIGGTWPDADCGCTAPTAATTSGGSMSVGYVAVYEYKGNSTPTATTRATGPLAGPGRLPGQRGVAQRRVEPGRPGRLRRQRRRAVVALQRRHAARPGRLPHRLRPEPDKQRRHLLVPLRQHLPAAMDAAVQRDAVQPVSQPLPHRRVGHGQAGQPQPRQVHRRNHAEVGTARRSLTGHLDSPDQIQ